MLTCREVARLVASGDTVRRSTMSRALVRLHIMMCRHCRRYEAELQALGQAVRMEYPEEVDPERIARLQARIDELGAQRDG